MYALVFTHVTILWITRQVEFFFLVHFTFYTVYTGKLNFRNTKKIISHVTKHIYGVIVLSVTVAGRSL